MTRRISIVGLQSSHSADAAASANAAATSEGNAAASAASALASKNTATTAATTATTKAAEAVATRAGIIGDLGTTDSQTATLLAPGSGSLAEGVVRDTYGGPWRPSTSYAAGLLFAAPNGTIRQVTADHTSGTTYSTANSSSLLDPYAIPTRTSAGISGWTTSQEVVARALGWVIITDRKYAGGAKGDGATSDTAAITAAIAALPSSGGVLYSPPGTYMCANLTVNKSNVTLRWARGAVWKKNANGPVLTWGAGGYTKLQTENIQIDGNGAAGYTGPGVVINGGNFPSLDAGEVVSTVSNALQFVGDGAGHSGRVSNMTLSVYDSAVGGANENVGAVLLPLDATQAPNRHFINIHSGTSLLFDDAGSQDSNWVNCTTRNVKFSGVPAKLYLTSVRVASSGAAISLTGTQAMFVASAFAGPVTLPSTCGQSTMAGCVIGSGGLTIAAGATANAIAGVTMPGEFVDQGTNTSVSGVNAAGITAPLPRTADPRLLLATQTLSANQSIFLRAHGRGYISKIGFHVGVSSGNICVGVFANNGLSGTAAKAQNRKATSGSVPCPAAGYAEIALTSPVYVNEGDWLAIAADNATASFYRAGAAGVASGLAAGISQRASSVFPLATTGSGVLDTLYSIILVGVA